VHTPIGEVERRRLERLELARSARRVDRDCVDHATLDRHGLAREQREHLGRIQDRLLRLDAAIGPAHALGGEVVAHAEVGPLRLARLAERRRDLAPDLERGRVLDLPLRDARIELNASGVEVRAKTELLGRELSNVHSVFPLSGLAVVRRDVRFPSLHVYVGLVALLVGTYLGVQFLSWGALGGSIRLLSYGFLLLAVGVVVDLLLVAIVPGSRGKVRVVVVPKRGATFCIGGLETQGADRLLAEIAKRAS